MFISPMLCFRLFDEPEVISTEATDDTVPQSNEGDESADVAAQVRNVSTANLSFLTH